MVEEEGLLAVEQEKTVVHRKVSERLQKKGARTSLHWEHIRLLHSIIAVGGL